MSKNNIVVSRTLEEYLELPYTIEVQKDDSDGEIAYAARVVELPGCITQGDTFEELEVMIQDAMRAWIESALAACRRDTSIHNFLAISSI